MRTARGWIVDVILGWVVGGIAGVIVAEVVFGRTGAAIRFGVLVGTVVGIVALRWRRASRRWPSPEDR